MGKTVTIVFKVLALTLLVVVGINTLASFITLKTTTDRLMSVGEIMEFEMARNNSIYVESYRYEDELSGFAAQLKEISDKSNGMFTFMGIDTVDSDGTVHELVKLADPATGIYSFSTDSVGKYGEFKTIRLRFQVHFTSYLIQGPRAVTVVTADTESEQVFEFSCPCLRYLKSEG